MFKKLSLILTAAVLTLALAGNAMATFGNLSLVRVVLQQTGGTTEIATDLGPISQPINLLTLNNGGGANAFTLQAGGTNFAAGTTGLNVAYFAVNQTTKELWITGASPTIFAGKSSIITALTTNIFTYYNSLGSPSILADASFPNSYRVKADASTQFGQFGGAIVLAARPFTEANLAPLATGGSVTQTLYYFSNYATASAGVAVATITTNADGSTTIGPPSKTNQTITSPFTFTPPTLVIGGSTSVSTTATSTLPVSFGTSTPTVCSVSTGGIISGLAAGICTVTADQAGNANWNLAPQVRQDITVLTPQAIGPLTFIPPNLTVNRTSAVSAVTNSGLTVSFSTSTPSVCSVTGTIVTGVAEGVCTVTADQAGDATYASAPQGTQNISVIPPFIKIGTATVPDNTLTAALALPNANTTIYLQAAPVFEEHVLMSNPVNIQLKGGYTDAAFTSQSSFTTIKGSLTIKGGGLFVSKIIVR